MLMRIFLMIIVVFLAGCVAASSASRGEPAAGQAEGEPYQVAPDAPPAAGESASPTPTPTSEPVRAPLDDFGPAPELTNTVWLNVDAPLRLAELRGNVVLLDMWTFG